MLLSYELAKQLKEAGFPKLEGWDETYSQIDRDTNTEYDFGYIPSLSELIEACNPQTADDFVLATEYGEWGARLMYAGYFEGWTGIKRDGDGCVNIDEKRTGSTPEEAVARLWLNLNKK